MATRRVRSEVENPLRRKSFKLTLRALDQQFNQTVTLPYNPESVNIAVAPSWAPVGASGVERDRSTWQNNAPTTITWTHILQARQTTVSQGEDFVINRTAYAQVESLLQTIEGWATRVEASVQRPTRVLLTMGETRQYEGHIQSFSYRTLTTGPDGYILRAEYDITFVVNPE